MLMALTIITLAMPGHHKDSCHVLWITEVYYKWQNVLNPEKTGLFRELKRLGGGGGHCALPLISVEDCVMGTKFGICIDLDVFYKNA